jgi:hypothetical protein
MADMASEVVAHAPAGALVWRTAPWNTAVGGANTSEPALGVLPKDGAIKFRNGRSRVYISEVRNGARIGTSLIGTYVQVMYNAMW